MIKANSTLRFALIFLVVFGVLMASFEFSRGTSFEQWVVEDGVVAPATALINLINPNEGAVRIERTIASPTSRLHVTRGCEGIEMILMLAAAVIAFPASWRRRLGGIVIGSVLAYGLGLLRLVALYFVLRYSPTAWEALHGLVLPLAPIILIACYFLYWSGGGRSRRSTSVAAQHAA